VIFNGHVQGGRAEEQAALLSAEYPEMVNNLKTIEPSY
jgi:hypothetical protein